MLKKLLKYEFIATGRIFLPLYGALIVVSFLQKLFFDFNFGNMRNISLNILIGAIPVLFTTLVVAVIVTTFIMMIMRFYKNLLSSEGYLMFTLPVSVSKLIWSYTGMDYFKRNSRNVSFLHNLFEYNGFCIGNLPDDKCFY